MHAKWFLVTFPALIASLSFAQKLQESSGKEPTTAFISTTKLTFVDEKDAPRLPVSQVIYGPIGWSPDGAILIETASPSDPRHMALTLIAEGHDGYSATSFSLQAISDLHDARSSAYFATESVVVVLVKATRDDALSTSKRTIVVPKTGESSEQEAKSGTRRDYLATFDRHGNHKGAVELDVPFTARRIGVFSSGLFW